MFGIQVPFEDGWLWITEDPGQLEENDVFELKPLLFDDEQEALMMKEIWGDDAIVKEWNGVSNQELFPGD